MSKPSRALVLVATPEPAATVFDKARSDAVNKALLTTAVSELVGAHAMVVSAKEALKAEMTAADDVVGKQRGIAIRDLKTAHDKIGAVLAEIKGAI